MSAMKKNQTGRGRTRSAGGAVAILNRTVGEGPTEQVLSRKEYYPRKGLFARLALGGF